MVLDQLKEKGFYDDIGQFDVTDEVKKNNSNVCNVIASYPYLKRIELVSKILVEEWKQ